MTNRMREIRKRRGLTLMELAERTHSSHQHLSRLEKGERRMTFDWARRIAPALQVEPEELLADESSMVPVVGRVGAGAEVIPVDDHPKGAGLDHVPCPRGLNPAKTVAVEIRGDSMPPIGDGWLAFYSRDPEPDTAAVVGKLCIVKVADGRTLLKQVRRGPTAGHFNLLSTNAPMIEDVALEWAAPVKAILPPETARPD